MCVCVYLVQVCLAACAESPLAWVSPSGPPHLLLESAEQHKPPCFYLFFLFVFFPVWTDQSSHQDQFTCLTAVRLVSVPRPPLSAITRA